jgi:hypothetical protein
MWSLQRSASKHKLAGQFPVSCHRFRGRHHAICPSAPTMSSAVSYAANVGSPPGFSGWANQVEPAVAQPLGRRQMRPIGDCLVWPTPAWSWMRLLAAGQRRPFRKFESKGSPFGQGQIQQSIVACPIRSATYRSALSGTISWAANRGCAELIRRDAVPNSCPY